MSCFLRFDTELCILLTIFQHANILKKFQNTSDFIDKYTDFKY